MEYSFLRKDALPIPPLPLAFVVTADSDVSSALWGWLGSVRATLWKIVWGIALVPPWMTVASALQHA
jgi:hypothetical protein